MLNNYNKDKFLLKLEWVIGILSIIILFAPIFLSAYIFTNIQELQRILIAFSGFIPAFIGFLYCVKIEQIAGYYKCKHCKCKHTPNFKNMVLSPHVGRTRYMICPKCNMKSWQNKVIEE